SKFAVNLFFLSEDSASTEIYTLSLHDALPISRWRLAHLCSSPGRCSSCPAPGPATSRGRSNRKGQPPSAGTATTRRQRRQSPNRDRKSTRLNSSHVAISYAVFCLKKKKI